jgi:hypothetical protein
MVTMNVLLLSQVKVQGVGVSKSKNQYLRLMTVI